MNGTTRPSFRTSLTVPIGSTTPSAFRNGNQWSYPIEMGAVDL